MKESILKHVMSIVSCFSIGRMVCHDSLTMRCHVPEERHGCGRLTLDLLGLRPATRPDTRFGRTTGAAATVTTEIGSDPFLRCGRVGSSSSEPPSLSRAPPARVETKTHRGPRGHVLRIALASNVARSRHRSRRLQTSWSLNVAAHLKHGCW